MCPMPEVEGCRLERRLHFTISIAPGRGLDGLEIARDLGE